MHLMGLIQIYLLYLPKDKVGFMTTTKLGGEEKGEEVVLMVKGKEKTRY